MTADPRSLAADHLNHYAGTLHHVHDADTLYCLVWDPIMQMYALVGVRVRWVQCPELTEPGGVETRAAVVERVPVDATLLFGEVGAYSRPGHIVATVTLPDGTDLSDWLLERGYAVRWDGKGKRPVVPWPPPEPGAAAGGHAPRRGATAGAPGPHVTSNTQTAGHPCEGPIRRP